MFHFCAICMVKRSLVELNSERRRFLEILVSPFINLDSLKSCRVLICLNCNRLLSTMLRFQQTVLKGLLNLVALHKRTVTNYVCHNLPAVINGETDKDMLLPVVSEEVVASSDYSVDPTMYYIHGKLKPTRSLLKPTDSLYDEEKLLETKNTKEPSEHALEILESNPRKTVTIDKDLKPTRTKPQSNGSSSSSATHSCESDFDNPNSVPGYNQVVSTSETYDHGYTDKHDMAVLVPIKTTTDNSEPVDTKESYKVEKMKLNNQLYKAIKLALKSNSISEDIDITQYEPESESGLESPYKKDSESRLESPYKKDYEYRLGSPHEKDSESRLESPHEKDSESRLESPHEIDSTDSESTLSCHSNYEDAETFPNVVFANAFKGVSDDEQDENVNNKMHVVTDPPGEWPCTFEPCSLKHHLYDGDDNFSDDFEEDTYLGARSRKTLGRRRSRKKCNLCNQFFPNVYSLWVHYERDHVDVCNRECCNEKYTNRKISNTKQSKVLRTVRRASTVQKGVQEIAEKEVQWKGCAECGVRIIRRSGNIQLHYTSIRHRVVAQWRFQCDICKRKLIDKVQLAFHIEREHSEKGVLKCPMCSTSFRSSRALHKHAAAHILADTNTNADTNTVDKTTMRKIDLRETNTNTDTVDSPKATRTVADLRKALNNRTRTEEITLNGRKRAVGKPRKTLKKRARTVANLQTTQNGRKRSANTLEPQNSNVRKKTKDIVISWAAMQDKSNTGLRQYGNKRMQVRTFSNIQDGFERADDSNIRETVEKYSNTHDRVQDYNSTWKLNPYGYKRMQMNELESQDSNTRSQSQDGFEIMQDNTLETQHSGNTGRLKPYGYKQMRNVSESVHDSNIRSQSQEGFVRMQDNTHETQYSGNTRRLKPYGKNRMRLIDGLGSVRDNNTQSQSQDGFESMQDNTHETQYSGNTRRLKPYGDKRMQVNASASQDSDTRSKSQNGYERMQDNTHETQYSGNTRRLKPYGKKRMRLIDGLESVLDSKTRSQSQDGFESMQGYTGETQYSGNTRRLKPYGKKRMRLIDGLESVLDSKTRSQSQDGFESMQDYTRETQYSGNTQRLKPYSKKQMQESNVSELVEESNTRSQSEDGFEIVQHNTHETQYSGNTRRLKQYGNKRKASNVSVQESNYTSGLIQGGFEQTQNGTRETIHDSGNTRETTQHGNTRMKLYDNKRMQVSNIRGLIEYAFERTQDSNTVETSSNTQFKEHGSNTHETQDNTRETQDTHMRRKVQKPRWRPKTVRALRKQTKNASRANKKENAVGPRRNDLYDSWLQIAGVPSPTMPS